ncbi:MAG TPA: DUF2911 domain-containing protein [Parafilimonas sp.]|nr:DUF2911 domain-containing protein [Parafilimonas sp.]
MKKFLSLALFSGILLMSVNAHAQDDKSKRPSPPAIASGTTAEGTEIKIDYSQPSVKGREIGKDVEPKKGKVWRTGANEATVFEVSKDVTIEGEELPAGKYGLYSIWNGDTWTIIFNKTWNQWGTNYKEGDDALRVTVPNVPPASPSEKMTFNVGNDGKVNLAWGGVGFNFTVM